MRCAALGSFLVATACSVYSADLTDGQTSSITDDGHAGADSTQAGGGSGSSGKPGANGGRSGSDGVDPTEGGDASGDSPGAGGGGAAPNGGTEGGGVPGTAGGSGAGTAGSGGGAGATTGGSGGTGATADLIDGFEDDDITLEQNGGRGGVWYLFDDGTVGTAGPSPLVCSPLGGAPAALGAYAMHITATGFTSWGTGLGVDFRAGKKVYDASKYTGIRFWARVGAGKNTRHRLQLADATTDAAGGKCNPAATAPEGEKCEDHFGINETFTSVWTQYIVRFDELSQIGWGNPAPAVDKSALYGLQITAKAKLEVDLWLDQIEFF
jgi:hypothetical protein